MLTSFVLSMALAAPVPPASTPATSGPAPQLLEIKADPNGKLMVTVMRMEKQKVKVVIAVAPGGNPGGAPGVVEREVTVPRVAQVELNDVKDLKITSVSGKKVEVADAMKALKGGGVVLVSADGKPVDAKYLKLFKDDVLVLTAPELFVPRAMMGGPFPGGGFAPGAVPAPPVQPLPAPVPPPALPAAPALPPAPGGVIQIQIQPGQIQVLPVNPVPAPGK